MLWVNPSAALAMTEASNTGTDWTRGPADAEVVLVVLVEEVDEVDSAS